MSSIGSRTNRSHLTGVAARIGKYSDAVEVTAGSRLLYLAGTPGLPPEGDLPESFVEQAEQAWRNVIGALTRADMDVHDLVKITQYLTRPEDIKAYAAVRARFLGDARPASMLMVVPALVWPGILIEIDGMAARADAPGRG
jgi:2-iminobutanoate/2-iminopropanoate deaminase